MPIADIAHFQIPCLARARLWTLGRTSMNFGGAACLEAGGEPERISPFGDKVRLSANGNAAVTMEHIERYAAC